MRELDNEKQLVHSLAFRMYCNNNEEHKGCSLIESKLLCYIDTGAGH